MWVTSGRLELFSEVYLCRLFLSGILSWAIRLLFPCWYGKWRIAKFKGDLWLFKDRFIQRHDQTITFNSMGAKKYLH